MQEQEASFTPWLTSCSNRTLSQWCSGDKAGLSWGWTAKSRKGFPWSTYQVPVNTPDLSIAFQPLIVLLTCVKGLLTNFIIFHLTLSPGSLGLGFCWKLRRELSAVLSAGRRKQRTLQSNSHRTRQCLPLKPKPGSYQRQAANWSLVHYIRLPRNETNWVWLW